MIPIGRGGGGTRYIAGYYLKSKQRKKLRRKPIQSQHKLGKSFTAKPYNDGLTTAEVNSKN